MEISDAKVKELIHAIAKDTKADNIIAAEGFTRDFIDGFAKQYADEICKKRKEIHDSFHDKREVGRVHGIDVSSWQGVIEWNKVKQSEQGKFAMLRAAYGTEADCRFEENYRAAERARIPIGAYLYTLALDEQQAINEADRLIEQLKGKKFSYPIALDIEESSQAALGAERVSAIIDAFCKRLEGAKYYVSVYSYESFITTLLTDEIKNKYDLWVADIGGVPDISYGMLQYSFRGSVDGISGDVDLDYAVKDYPSIIKKSKLNGY